MTIQDLPGTLTSKIRDRLRIDDQGFESFTTADGLADNFVRSLLEDQHGHLWVGTDGGAVCRWDGQRFESFTADDKHLSDGETRAIRALLEDRHGHLWVGGWGGGLGRYDGQTIETIPAEDGLPGNRVSAILEDRGVGAWRCTNAAHSRKRP